MICTTSLSLYGSKATKLVITVITFTKPHVNRVTVQCDRSLNCEVIFVNYAKKEIVYLLLSKSMKVACPRYENGLAKKLTNHH